MKKLFIIFTIISNSFLFSQIKYNEEYLISTGDYNLYSPSSTFLDNGSSVVCWEEDNGYQNDHKHSFNIYTKIYDSNGIIIKSKLRVNQIGKRIHKKPTVFQISDDRFIIGWQSELKSGETIGLVMQIFSNDGTKIGDEITISSMQVKGQYGDYYRHKSYSFEKLDNDKFIVVFENNQLYAQILDIDGNKIGNEFQINSWSGGNTLRCNIATISDNKFIICWDGYNENNNVYARIYNFDGIASKYEFPVNIKNDGINRDSKIIIISDDKFLITWIHYGNNEGIYGQYFDSEGNKQNTSFILNQFTIPYKFDYHTASLTNGNFIISWYNNENSYCQLYNSHSQKFGKEFINNEYGKDLPYAKFFASTLSTNNTDQFITTWTTGDWYSDIIKAKNYLCQPIDHELTDFDLIIPTSNVEIDSTNPTLVWSRSNAQKRNFPWEISYTLHYSCNPNFIKEKIVESIQDTIYQLTSLVSGKNYYWKIEAETWNGKKIQCTSINRFSTKKMTHAYLNSQEHSINSETKYGQQTPVITSLNDEKFVVGWMIGNGIFKIQSFDQNFNTVGKNYEKYIEMYPITGHNITALNDEIIAAIYQFSDMGIEQRGFFANPTTDYIKNIDIFDYVCCISYRYTNMTALPNNRMVLCCSSNLNILDENAYSTDYNIIAKIIDENGENDINRFQVNTSLQNQQTKPSIASFSNGDFLICWESENQDGSSWGIFGQKFDSTGIKIGNEFQVNTTIENNQKNVKLCTLQNSNIIAVWESNEQDSSGSGIFGQILDNSGNKIGDEFQINTFTINDQTNPVVCSRSNGDFVVSWQSTNQDGDGEGIFLQVFDNDGKKLGNEHQVNTYTTSDQSLPAITTLSNDDVVICWQSEGQDGDGWGIYAKKLPTNYSLSTEQILELNNYKLNQNYPNPFNSSTRISYSIPKESNVKLTIYDLLGREIKTLINEHKTVGNYTANFDASGLSSGIYFYRLQIGSEFQKTRKMMYLR